MDYLEMERLARRLLMHYYAWRMHEDPEVKARERARLDGFAEALGLFGFGAMSTIVEAVDEEYNKLAYEREFGAIIKDSARRAELIFALVKRLEAMRSA